MRISDWSSDVCSSDLDLRAELSGVRPVGGKAVCEDCGIDVDIVAAARCMAERQRQQDQYGRQIQQDDLALRSAPQRRKLAAPLSTDATAVITIHRRVRPVASTSP